MSVLKSFTVRVDERLYERLVIATERHRPRVPKRYAGELALSDSWTPSTRGSSNWDWRSMTGQRLLYEGVYATVSEIGDAENISKSFISRILRLALLAPDIVEAILSGKTDVGLMLESLERPLPTDWSQQREHFS